MRGRTGEEGQPRGQTVITQGKSLWSAVRLDWEKAGRRLRKSPVSFEMSSFVPSFFLILMNFYPADVVFFNFFFLKGGTSVVRSAVTR